MPRKTSPSPSSSTDGVDLRSSTARATFDASILKYVLDVAKPVSSNDVLNACGGTLSQVRASLNRAIGDGVLSWSGQTRSTRYFAPGAESAGGGSDDNDAAPPAVDAAAEVSE